MYKRTITFEDYDGNTRTEEHYFNLNKAEIIRWLTTGGDYTLDKKLERLTQERNGKEIMNLFEEMIHLSYGRKSLDGRRFEKSPEIWANFYETEAYSELFTELVTDAKAASDFLSGVIPKSLSEEVDKMIQNDPDLASKITQLR